GTMSLKTNLQSLGLALPEDLNLDDFLARIGNHPARNTIAAVAVGALMFYVVEKNRNPKVNDVWDAAIYTSTCLSVGYGDIFAKTPIGKIIGTALMTIGPALSNAALDGAANTRHQQSSQTQEQILSTLQQILAKLQSPTPIASSP